MIGNLDFYFCFALETCSLLVFKVVLLRTGTEAEAQEPKH